MDESASIPTAMLESTTRDESIFSHSKERTVTRAETKSTPKGRPFGEASKELKVIFEDAGVPFVEPTDKASFVDRHTVAKKLKAKQIEEVLRAILRAREVQLCFLVDVTGSMQPHINGVRDSINDIVRKLTDHPTVGKNAEARSMSLAFVAYRDHEDRNQFETLPFSSDVGRFKAFVGALSASGGGDEPEDVFGGLETALNLHWSENCGTSVLFHIADAPCHGREFQRPGTGDSHAAGDPKGRTHTALFSKLRSKGIQYHFGKINASTDIMIDKFAAAYGEPIDAFDIKNVVNIRDSVVTAVSKSISASVSASHRAGGIVRAVREVTIDKTKPVWSTIKEVEGRFVSYEFPKSIEDIVANVALETRKSKSAQVKIAPHPFGKGAERYAYYGMDVTTYVGKVDGKDGKKKSSSESAETVLVKEKCEEIVLKEYLHIGKGMNSAKRYELSNQMQTVSAYLARQFCKDLKDAGIDKKIKFLKIRTFYKHGEPLRFMTCERVFAATDKFVRFTNNTDYAIVDEAAIKAGVSLEFVQLVLAFSHWTYKATNRHLMVVDLEGIVGRIGADGETGVLLTDPAIHCTELTRFGKMNHGPGGMKNFFASHVCNQFCRSLGLEGFK